jgi:predicted enzyme related to lactoylglutathione lyase
MATKAKKKAAAPRKTAPKKKAAAPKQKAAAPRKTTAKKAAPKKAAPKKAARPAVVHWEVTARDAAKQQRFFAELFAWKIDANNPMQYGMVESGGKDAINGGIGAGDQPLVTVYVQVTDINATLAKAESLGAETVMPRTDVGPVIMGQFRDLEGNVIGLVEG